MVEPISLRTPYDFLKRCKTFAEYNERKCLRDLKGKQIKIETGTIIKGKNLFNDGLVLFFSNVVVLYI